MTNGKECGNVLTEEFLEMGKKARGNELLKYVRVKVAQGVEDLCLADTLNENQYNETVRRVMKLIDNVTTNAVEVELLRL